MKSVGSFFACALLTVSLAGLSASAALAAQGQDFPNTTCTCKGCGTGGGDLTGNCASVCKDKTVFSKGSEPHDYCKKAATMTGNGLLAGLTLAGIKAERLANFSRVPTSTIRGMSAVGNKPVRANRRTVRKVIHALKVRGGVEITEDGVRLVRKPRR